MPSPAELLWWYSHEYGQRLAKAGTYFELLEQLFVERDASESRDAMVAALTDSRAYLNSLREDFRGWRYAFLYETPDSKRMVQTERAILRALGSFQRMRARHVENLTELGRYYFSLPRPDVQVTLVPTGDMWELMREALLALIDFDRDGYPEVPST